MLVIGDHVSLPRGQKAILRWIGRIPGRGNSQYAGVELVGPDARIYGKHSGEFQGNKYFSTQVPGSGLFVSYSQLASATLNSAGNRSSGTPSESLSHASPRASPRTLPRASSRPESQMSSSPLKQIKAEEPQKLSPALTDFSEPALEPESGLPQSQPSPSDLLARLEASEARNAALKQHLADKRAEFHSALADIHAHVDALDTEYQTRLRSIEKSARLNAENHGNRNDEDIEQQRLALAQFQNSLLVEAKQKDERLEALQAENASLRRELAIARNDDGQLEALSRDLEAQDQQLKEMHRVVAEAEDLKREIQQLRMRNAELEVAASPASSANSSILGNVHQLSRPETARDESYERMIHNLEAKAMRDVGLEDDIAALRVASASPATVRSNSISGRPSSLTHESSSSRAGGRTKSQTQPKPQLSEKQDFDLAAGRENWCALCEKYGHTAEECMFD